MPAALIALILVILFLAFGIGVLGFTLHIFWLLLWYGAMGLIIGGLARLFVPGRQDHLGLTATALFGIAGWDHRPRVAGRRLADPVPGVDRHRGSSGADQRPRDHRLISTGPIRLR